MKLALVSLVLCIGLFACDSTKKTNDAETGNDAAVSTATSASSVKPEDQASKVDVAPSASASMSVVPTQMTSVDAGTDTATK